VNDIRIGGTPTPTPTSALAKQADQANQTDNIEDPNKIKTGQQLNIPVDSFECKPTPGNASPAAAATSSADTAAVKTHTVKSSENIKKIAEKYNLSVGTVADFNGIKDLDIPLQIGQKLKIPPSDYRMFTKALASANAPEAPLKTPEKPPVDTTTYRLTNQAQPKRPIENIDTIVIHHTGGSTAKSAVHGLNDKNLSAHYLIDKDGTIHQLVPDNKRAEHAGKSAMPGEETKNGKINTRSIGIEIVNEGNGKDPFTDEQYKSLANLTAFLATEYKVPTKNILGHNEVSRAGKTDPDPQTFDYKKLANGMLDAGWREPQTQTQTVPNSTDSFQP